MGPNHKRPRFSFSLLLFCLFVVLVCVCSLLFADIRRVYPDQPDFNPGPESGTGQGQGLSIGVRASQP